MTYLTLVLRTENLRNNDSSQSRPSEGLAQNGLADGCLESFLLSVPSHRDSSIFGLNVILLEEIVASNRRVFLARTL